MGHLEISKPVPPYAEYKISKSEDELNGLWSYHEINESGRRSLFKAMERIRLMSSHIETVVDLHYLELNDHLVAHFPIHNKWQLNESSSEKQDIDDEDIKIRNALLEMSPLSLNQSLTTTWRTSLFCQKIPLSKIRTTSKEACPSGR